MIFSACVRSVGDARCRVRRVVLAIWGNPTRWPGTAENQRLPKRFPSIAESHFDVLLIWGGEFATLSG